MRPVWAPPPSPGTFSNPVIPGDLPDPSVIRVGETYYACGTSSEWAPFYPLFTSRDLVNWTQAGHLFEEQPEWTRSSFWAPELFHRDGRTYAYYTARRKSDGTSYIGVATADRPEGPYTDHGPVVALGTEAIDAFVLEDDGKLYISWKAYGLDRRRSNCWPAAFRTTACGSRASRSACCATMRGGGWRASTG